MKRGPDSKISVSKPGPLKRVLVKIYLSSPQKVQFALAKFGVKNVLKQKKKSGLKEILKH